MFAFLTMRRKANQLIAGALLLLGLAACDASFNLGGPSVDTSKPIPVALLVPYGSEQPQDIALAQSLENAARLAAADLQNVTIDLRVYPTAGQPAQAGAATAQAISEGAKIILGPVYGGNAKVAGLQAASSGINLLSFSNNPDVAGGNVFILGPTFDNTARRLASYARQNGTSNIMIVNGNSPAENIGAASIRSALALNGLNVAAEQSFEMSQQAVVNVVRPISESVEETGAQAIFFTSGNDGAMPLLAQMLPENGIVSPDVQFIGLQRWNFPASALSLPGMQGSWFTVPDQALITAFNNRYAAQFGEAPHSLAGLAYDGIAAVGALASSGQSNALTGAALTRPAGFAGVNGVFRLLADGTNERGLSIATIQDSQVVEIDPAPRAFGTAGF